MPSFAIIGSGIAGLLTAHALRKAGFDVTVYSDRTPEQWLKTSRPTGTAARFEMALSIERELGLNHWEHEAPKGGGAHVSFCLKKGNRLVTLAGRLAEGTYFQAIDVRLQSARWMEDLEARGGKIVIEAVTVPRLDEIAAQHDLTIVAGGRAELSQLFPRDEKRSPYDKPQRRLAMVKVRNARLGFDGVPFLPVKFNLFAPFGEAFWVPYFHKDVGPCWSLLVEGKPGSPFDRYGDAKSANDVLDTTKELIRELVPWDYDWIKDAETCDENGWLVGSFAPTVREPVGRLPSGRVVAAVGDTQVSMDPVAGQGANAGIKMARHLVDRIVAHGDRPFDAAFLTASFEGYWARHGAATNEFSRVLLEPLTEAGQTLLISQYGSDGERIGQGRGAAQDGKQRIADAFIENFRDPAMLTDAFTDATKARAVVAEKTGRPAWKAVLAGRAGIVRGQLRQALGMAPNHPLARAEVVKVEEEKPPSQNVAAG